jgi:hypothetical protein
VLETNWTKIIPPREWRKIREKIFLLKRLAKEIDRGYASGRFEGIEEKEVRAERLEEELSALHDVYSDASDAPWIMGEGYSLDELLIQIYTHPESFVDRAGWLANMKENIRLLVQPYNPALEISDEQALSIAREALEMRQRLLGRYRSQLKSKRKVR